MQFIGWFRAADQGAIQSEVAYIRHTRGGRVTHARVDQEAGVGAQASMAIVIKQACAKQKLQGRADMVRWAKVHGQARSAESIAGR